MGLMRDIYKGAECVLICLTGEENNTFGMERAIAAGPKIHGSGSTSICTYEWTCLGRLGLGNYIEEFLGL